MAFFTHALAWLLFTHAESSRQADSPPAGPAPFRIVSFCLSSPYKEHYCVQYDTLLPHAYQEVEIYHTEHSNVLY